MSYSTEAREVWHPQTEADNHAVLDELKAVLSSPHFCNSKRYPALLRYVVETTLVGRASSLKERTLGIEVFGRPATYDTSLDTVVRYTAGEIRKRLLLYYHGEGRDAAIQIHLPTGSYVPEFTCSQPGGGLTATLAGSAAIAEEPSWPAVLVAEEPFASGGSSSLMAAAATRPGLRRPSVLRSSGWWVALAALVVAAALGFGPALRSRWTHHPTAVDAFWQPLIHQTGTALFGVGGSVFEQNEYSGVRTADKNADYPFVSMQIASSLPRISQVIDGGNKTYEIQPAASTLITQMRDRPLVLLGGYNNEWTMRMLRPLRYQFSSEPRESIFDTQQAGTEWSRDRSLPYSSADDYAIVARFWAPSTDSYVVVLAGLGRNGTEVAAQFATSARYMEMVRERIGHELDTKNIEIVLQAKVYDGKTGAPTILAIHTW